MHGVTRQFTMSNVFLRLVIDQQQCHTQCMFKDHLTYYSVHNELTVIKSKFMVRNVLYGIEASSKHYVSLDKP